MNKHTPGPWHVGEHHSGMAVDVITDERYLVATAYQEEREANAALIASAPTLLAERDALRAEREEICAANYDLVTVNHQLRAVLREIVTQWDCDEIGRIDGDVIGRAEKLLDGTK